MEINEIELSVVSYKLHCVLSVAGVQPRNKQLCIRPLCAIYYTQQAQSTHNALINRGKKIKIKKQFR